MQYLSGLDLVIRIYADQNSFFDGIAGSSCESVQKMHREEVSALPVQSKWTQVAFSQTNLPSVFIWGAGGSLSFWIYCWYGGEVTKKSIREKNPKNNFYAEMRRHV